MSIASAHALPRLQAGRMPVRAVGLDVVVALALLAVALGIGLATASDYGFTVDEFNTDDYGPKALAWYTSLGADRSHFETVEEFLWYYGPWHQILTALAQSVVPADPFTVRHAMTFLAGIVGLSALIPVARLSVGGWAGPVAIVLCLMTGYFYGSLFFTPIDVPFLAAMTWAVCTILLMARHEVPGWPATIAAGLVTGLAMATRPAGIITHAYLIGAMSLCALEAAIRKGRAAKSILMRIAARTAAVVALAWVTMIALWPWLQIGNPLSQFATAYLHFTHNPMSFPFLHWGEIVKTDALPWSYIPAQMLARLPEGFLLLLAAAFAIGIVATVRFAGVSLRRFRDGGAPALRAPALVLARSRGTLLVAAAALVPVGFVILTRATHYDGIRHVLFVFPMLALLAGGAALRLLPLLRRHWALGAVIAVLALAHIGTTISTLGRLHPLEYVAMNSLTGGTKGAEGRFELDYWGAAASEAVARLEQRLDQDTTGRFASRPPRVRVCVLYRDSMADRLFRRNWILEVDPARADFTIDSERWRCGAETRGVLIDEVKRLDVTFSRIYAHRPSAK